MKELTIEEKAKAYDKALGRAKALYSKGAPDSLYLEEMFPVLKESEDDRIRKWIIDDIRYNLNNEPLNNSEYRKKAEEAIAWLEKSKKNRSLLNGAKRMRSSIKQHYGI